MGAKVRQATTNFTNGELSPRLAGRFDRDLYRNGAESLKNMMLQAQGGTQTRWGTRYRATLPQSPAILVPFTFALSQRYLLAFSNARLDIYLPDGTALTPITSAPWTSAMLSELSWAHSGDTLLLFHKDMPTQVIKRTGATTFTRAVLAFETASGGFPVYEPYYKFAEPAVTLTPSSTTGSVTLTASAAVFSPSHVGARIRYAKKTCTVTAYTSATVVTVTVNETLSGTSASTDWDEAVVSPARGYPRCGAFHSGRLFMAGTRERPAGIWASKVGAFFNFDLGTALDNEGIWETVDGPRVSEIRRLESARHLMIFADRAMFYVPQSTSAPITPKTFDAREQAPYGCALVQPRLFDSAVQFVHEAGRAVREATWSDTEQAYVAPVVSLLSEHLIQAPTSGDALYGGAAGPEQFAFYANANGTLAVFHSVREQKIAGWVPWETAGAWRAVAVAGREVFVLAERTLATGPAWTLEVFDPDAAALDCGIRATSGSATKTFSGFDAFDGRTVQVSTKGHPLGDYVPAGGDIVLGDLAPEVTEIEAGFAFEQRITPMPFVVDMQDGPSLGLTVDLIRAWLVMSASLQFEVDGDQVLIEFAGDDYANPPPTKTGVVEVAKLRANAGAQFTVSVDQPLKVSILALSREVQING